MTEPQRVRPSLALVLSLIGFLALVIAGFGFGSLLSDSEVVNAPSQMPGIAGLVGAGVAYAGSCWRGVCGQHPRYVSVISVTIATWLCYAMSVGVSAGIVTDDLAVGAAAVAALVLGWQGGVIALCAAVAGWAAIALVRTRSARPRWRWEAQSDEDA